MGLLSWWEIVSIMMCVFLWMSGKHSIRAATVTVDVPSVVLNDPVTATCSVDSTMPSLTYEWLQTGLSVQDGPSNSFRFSSVGIADVGEKYTCVVKSNGVEIGRNNFSVTANLPDFEWRTSKEPRGDSYIGQRTRIICLAFLGDTAGLSANSSILDPQGNAIPSGREGDRVRVYDLMPASNGYETVLEFTALSASDVGFYTCTGNLMPAIPSPYITNGVGSATFAITITLVTLSTRLVDFNPYNRLALTCVSSAKVRSRPLSFNVSFTWYQSVDGGPFQEVGKSVEYGSNVTNRLSVNVSEPGSHTYLCQVSLDVRPAPDNITEISSVTIRVYGASPPAPPVNLNTSIIKHNTVTVEWEVPVVNYDPETYVVRYGTDSVSLTLVSDSVMGLRVELTSLMASTRYYYRVEATNSNGTTSSSTGTFTTASSSPSGSPGVPTANATTSTTITLTWTEIDVSERNGDIINYIILYGKGNIRDTIINTQSNATTHLITGLKPFTQYTFTVAGVNSVGTGPFSTATQLISTSQDRPTAVRNIKKMATFTVFLSWEVPEQLNGILVNYIMQYSINGTRELPQTTNTTNFSITNLTLNTLVSDITVSANTGGGEGPAVKVADIVLSEMFSQGGNNSFTLQTSVPVIVAVLATLLLYSLVLVIMGFTIYCWRRRNSKKPEVSPHIEIEKCPAYESVKEERPTSYYETIEEDQVL